MSDFETIETPHFVYPLGNDETAKVSALHRPDRPDVFTNEGGDVTDAIVWHESWVENVYRLSDWMLTGGVVVDLGANIGAFSTLILAVNADEHVIAVEPTADNRALLIDNITANGWDDRCSILPYAVGFEAGTCSMAANGGAAHVVPGADVEVRTLGALTQGVTDIDILKIDIEGAEWPLFRYGSDAWGVVALANHIVMEWHSVSIEILGRFLGKLSETHSFDIMGKPSTGGMLYAHRHGV